MPQLNKDTYRFLKDLKANNNRDWFNSNKDRYTAIREDFINFLESVHYRLCEFDPSLKGIDVRKSVFRINRDVRFSEDKSPYKNSIAGVLIEGGRKKFSERAGYYLHIEPGHSVIAGGAYLPPATWLNRIRMEIVSDSESFRKLLEDKNFVRYFGVLSGDKLKGAPRGYQKDHPDIDLIRYKSYMAVHEFSKEEALSNNFADHFIDVARSMKPLNDFLNWDA